MKCHVFVLDKYLSKLPAEAFVKDTFYVQPRTSIDEDTQAVWFTANPIGRNTLANLVKDMLSFKERRQITVCEQLESLAFSRLVCQKS